MKIIVGLFAAGLTLAAVAGPVIITAEANQCVQQCRAAHSQCRISTKGSPSCDGQLQACMDSCRNSR